MEHREDKPGSVNPPRKPARSIPTAAAGGEYAARLDDYLDRLLDDTLEATFPASDPTAVSRPRGWAR